MNKLIEIWKDFRKSVRIVPIMVISAILNLILFLEHSRIWLYLLGNLAIILLVIQVYLESKRIVKLSNLRKSKFESLTNQDVLEICKENNDLDLLFKITKTIFHDVNYTKEELDEELKIENGNYLWTLAIPLYKEMIKKDYLKIK